jgi:hypothetical protein
MTRADGMCHLVYFAAVRGGGKARLRIGGVEQELGSGWSFPSTIPADHRQIMPFIWVDPVSRAVLAEQEVVVKCTRDGAPDYGALYNPDGTMK